MIVCSGPAAPAARSSRCPAPSYAHPVGPDDGEGIEVVPPARTLIKLAKLVDKVDSVSALPLSEKSRSLRFWAMLVGLAWRLVSTTVICPATTVKLAEALTGCPPAVAPGAVLKL